MQYRWINGTNPLKVSVYVGNHGKASINKTVTTNHNNANCRDSFLGYF